MAYPDITLTLKPHEVRIIREALLDEIDRALDTIKVAPFERPSLERYIADIDAILGRFPPNDRDL